MVSVCQDALEAFLLKGNLKCVMEEHLRTKSNVHENKHIRDELATTITNLPIIVMNFSQNESRFVLCVLSSLITLIFIADTLFLLK